MTATRFLLGLPLALAVLAPLGAAAAAVRRRLLPGWHGPHSLLVDLVLGLVGLTLISESLGSVGQFALRPLLVTSLVVGIGVWAALRRWPGDESMAADMSPPGQGSEPIGRAGWVTVCAGVALVVGSWLTRTVSALAHGITTVDSNWYHLPIAARFVQSGRVDQIQALDPDSVTAYFPATSSLFHAVGFLLFRSDLVSVVVNLGWLAMALLAAWCIGRSFGLELATTATAAILLGSPGMVDTQPGGALTDVVGLALILTMVAVALHRIGPVRSPAQDVIVALAGGLATGMKFTFLFPVVAIALVLVATAPAGVRLRRLGLVALGGTVSGGYWYGRNVLLTGNPLPALDANLGPIHLRAVEGVAHATTLRSLLFSGDAWNTYLLPGLRDAYGPVWVAVLAIAAVGMVGAIVRGPTSTIRGMGIAAAASTVAYVYNPQYLFGGTFFATNLRYAAPGILIGLVLAPIVVRRWPTVVTAGAGLVLIGTQLDPTSWPVGFGGPSFFSKADRDAAVAAAGLTVLASLLVAAVVMVWRRQPAWHPHAPWAALLVPIVIVGGLAGVRGRYYQGRYDGFPPVPDAYAWADTVHGATIGLDGGFLAMKYPFVGADLSNRVQYLAVATPDGGFRPPATCEEWVRLLEEARLDYVALLAVPNRAVGTAKWTADQPDARLVDIFAVAEGTALELQVFRLDPATSRSCRS